MSDPRVGLLFNPKSVAIIGASADLAKASGLPLRNIVNSKFTGKIYPINPRAKRNQWISLLSHRDRPAGSARRRDLYDRRQANRCRSWKSAARRASRPRSSAPPVSAKTDRRGRSGRREVGEIAKRYDIRVCGPNCHGTFNVYQKYSLRLRSFVRLADQAGTGGDRVAQRRACSV